MPLFQLPLFQARDGYTLENAPGMRPALEVVRYEALVLQVELLTGGELAHGS